MKQTDNYKLNKPDGTDNYNIEDFNENADTVDTALAALAKYSLSYTVVSTF